MSAGMANLIEGLARAADVAELWASMSEGHAEVCRKKGELRQADRLVHIARAYRALAKTFRAEAAQEPTNPYNLLEGSRVAKDDSRDHEI